MSEKANVLIVDDERQMLLAMEAVLSRLGHQTICCSSAEEGLEILRAQPVQLIISDMKMPGISGLEFLHEVHKQQSATPFVLITAYGTINQAVEAMRFGAFDFVTKPFSAEDLQSVVERALAPAKAPTTPRTGKTTRGDGVAIVSNDPQFKRVLEIATTVARSAASVLIQGESGTGKELLARLIHSSSSRAEGPFVAVNCAAVPANLLESELFGHEKGSFTGATATRIGKFELANGGTILLDEISEMEEVLQAKLLRVLQEREVDRVGGQRPIPIDVRVIATTNRDIRSSVTRGEFREDLFYRLNVIPLMVPPLRDRKGDVRLLIEHFIRRYSSNSPKRIAPELMRQLEDYSWPGNVRELQNACERAVLLAGDAELAVEHFMLGSTVSAIASGEASDDDTLRLRSGLSVAEAEKRLILETLRSTNNNRTRAAELLGISIRTLRNKLHEYGVSEPAGSSEISG